MLASSLICGEMIGVRDQPPDLENRMRYGGGTESMGEGGDRGCLECVQAISHVGFESDIQGAYRDVEGVRGQSWPIMLV